MTIFTYEDYLEHAKMLSIDLRLSKKMEQSKKKEQQSFKYILNDVGEEYVLQEGENVQHKTGIIIKQKINAKKINNEHDKIFRTVLDKKIDVAKFLNKFLRLGIKAEELEKYNSSYIDQKFRNKEADIVYRIKEIWVLRIGKENANKILKKIEEGSGNMMAVMEMLIAENEKYINIGRQEGKMQKLREIVQKMLAENFSKDTIVKITGLKKEEIEKLK